LQSRVMNAGIIIHTGIIKITRMASGQN